MSTQYYDKVNIGHECNFNFTLCMGGKDGACCDFNIKKTIPNRIKYWFFCKFFPFTVEKWDSEIINTKGVKEIQAGMVKKGGRNPKPSTLRPTESPKPSTPKSAEPPEQQGEQEWTINKEVIIGNQPIDIKSLYFRPFRKKPVIIKACRIYRPFKVQTLNGMVTCDAGEWLIEGVKGELYPCKDDIFEQTYEEK